MPDLIEQIQVDIAIERGDGRSLRNAFPCWLHLSLVGHPDGETLLDESQQAPIDDPLTDERQELVMRNRREIAAKINFYHAPGSLIEIRSDRHRGVFGIALGTV